MRHPLAAAVLMAGTLACSAGSAAPAAPAAPPEVRYYAIADT